MKKLFEDELKATADVMVAMPWENRAFYRSYLTQTYHFVVHSTRLLAYAGGCVRPGEDSLHRRLCAHIGEEKGHDRLALRDLKQMGFDGDLEAEMAQTRNLYETQYYKILHQHPSALFGYILALEGVASRVCPLFMERVYKAHGIEASLFLKLHVEEDPGHVEEAFHEIAKMDPQSHALIMQNLAQSFANYRSFLTAIAEKTARSSRSAEPIFQNEMFQEGI